MRKNNGYEELANAVIEQAVRDYVRALLKLRHEPESTAACHTRIEVEAFFRSRWLTVFTTVEGAVLLGYAKQIAKAEIARKMKSKHCKSYSAFVD